MPAVPVLSQKGLDEIQKTIQFCTFQVFTHDLISSSLGKTQITYMLEGHRLTTYLKGRLTNNSTANQGTFGHCPRAASGCCAVLCCPSTAESGKTERVCAHHATALPHRLQIPQPTSTQQHLTPFPSSRHLNPPCSIISNFLKFFHKL